MTRSWLSPIWSLPSSEPLFLPKQRKFAVTLVTFMQTGSLWWICRGKKQVDTELQKQTPTLQCFTRHVGYSCCPGPLTWEAWLYLKGFRWMDAGIWDRGMKLELLTPSVPGNRAWTCGFCWVMLCDPFLLNKARTVWSEKPLGDEHHIRA